MRNRVAKAIENKAAEDEKLYLISGDAGLGVWEGFKETYPERFLNPGVNEACDVGMASGLALRGYKVVYYNIAPFVIMRPYEQVRNDVCYQELPVIMVGTGSGITYAPAGMTHYVIEDIALAKTMPNLNIFSPCDPIEADAAFAYAYAADTPTYIRIPKNGEPELHKSTNIDITKPHVLREGKDALIIFHGSIVDAVLPACDTLSEKGIEVCAVSNPMVSNISDELAELINKYDSVYVAEEHYEYGGLGTIITDYCNEKGIFKKINKIALKNEYIHKVGNRDYLREHYGISIDKIVKFICSKVEK
ncbi:MAG: transketolase [Denitrovibrio sp.]|nr:MAG: transketolase [Denitrovibrio sp.]